MALRIERERLLIEEQDEKVSDLKDQLEKLNEDRRLSVGKVQEMEKNILEKEHANKEQKSKLKALKQEKRQLEDHAVLREALEQRDEKEEKLTEFCLALRDCITSSNANSSVRSKMLTRAYEHFKLKEDTRSAIDEIALSLSRSSSFEAEVKIRDIHFADFS